MAAGAGNAAVTQGVLAVSNRKIQKFLRHPSVKWSLFATKTGLFSAVLKRQNGAKLLS